MLQDLSRILQLHIHFDFDGLKHYSPTNYVS